MEIAVISGKGGTGKSSISAAFISLMPEVMAIDCDVDASNLYLLFHFFLDKQIPFISGKKAIVNEKACIGCKRCAELCRFDAIEMKDGLAIIDEINCDGCALCSHICPINAIKLVPADKSKIYTGTFRYGSMAYGRLAPGEENSGKMVNELRQISYGIVKTKAYKTTVLDGPPGIGCPVISTLIGVDKVVVVTEPTLSGFSDLKRTIELIRHYSLPTYVIVNKFTLNKDITEEINGWCIKEKIPIVAFLPFNIEMVKALVNKKSIVEYNPDSKLVELLKKALSDIIH